MENYSRKEINDKYVDGVKQLADKPGNRFGLAIFITDEGETEAIVNMHTIKMHELTTAIKRVVEGFYDALEKRQNEEGG